jgi:molybdopterin-containing oxidoreductase family iron-sulfur binding subunit
MSDHQESRGEPWEPTTSSRPELLRCRSASRPLWRSLEELAGDESFLKHLEREYPSQATAWLDGTSRRRFLRLMGASLALSGIAGCAIQPLESIVPYVEQPESIVPGKPLFFATAATVGGFGVGVLAESQMGRPIKLEGNPAHPASLGATCATTQAEILSLYDPDRSQVVLRNGRVDTWERFQSDALNIREGKIRARGRGLRLLTPPVNSPTLAAQLDRLLRQFPESHWHAYEPVGREAIRAGSRMLFGESLEPRYHLERADVVLALDADFLVWGPEQLRLARDFASRREPRGADDSARAAVNRLYAVEPTPSLTGAAADHRLILSARDIVLLAEAIAAAFRVDGETGDESARLSPHREWISGVVRDLQEHRGRSLVVAGDAQPAAVHALALAVNHALGNIGETVTLHPPPEEIAGEPGTLPELIFDIGQGQVDTLLLLGVNPVYDAPADLEFADAIRSNVERTIHLGLYDDETAQHCTWHIPQAHFLETWGDIRGLDGTVTIQQPLIAPLYGGKSVIDVLSLFLGEPARSCLEIVREHWSHELLPGESESSWRQALRDGTVPGTAIPAKPIAPSPKRLSLPPRQAAGGDEGLELVFRPDPTIWDGSHANNGWLQELPRPLTRLTWENAALVSPQLAGRLGAINGEVLELRYQGRAVLAPLWITPGQAAETVTVFLGYGRWRAGRVGSNLGYNAYSLRTSDTPWFGAKLEISRTGTSSALATVQHHHNMAGRDLVRVGKMAEFLESPGSLARSEHAHAEGPSLYPEAPRGEDAENRWGMAIDLNRCIGCGSCVIACQAENNIPIVGKEEVLRSREMHWLRVDRYYEGDDASNPRTYFQPVPCMHCEKAPCELVCPVGATTHSDEGLNEMTYNRCVGTRYCSNNCPYKVRRFNFLQYSDEKTESLKLLRNPDVTVRSRGVMEKCTYCVQRINHARIAAKIEGRSLGGDEVVTACQGACPARAIIFGNLSDPESAVARAKSSTRNYTLLAELNTLPRTSYLARLLNPNTAVESIPEIRSE